MRHAILDADRVIKNIIEVEPELAQDFAAHYLGDNPIGIGDQYPNKDLVPPVAPDPPTAQEQQRADIDFIAAMTGVQL